MLIENRTFLRGCGSHPAVWSICPPSGSLTKGLKFMCQPLKGSLLKQSLLLDAVLQSTFKTTYSISTPIFFLWLHSTVSFWRLHPSHPDLISHIPETSVTHGQVVSFIISVLQIPKSDLSFILKKLSFNPISSLRELTVIPFAVFSLSHLLSGFVVSSVLIGFLLQTTRKRRMKAWELISLSLAPTLLLGWKEILTSKGDWSYRDSCRRQPCRSSIRESKANPLDRQGREELAWHLLNDLHRMHSNYSLCQSSAKGIVSFYRYRNSELIYQG